METLDYELDHYCEYDGGDRKIRVTEHNLALIVRRLNEVVEAVAEIQRFVERLKR